MEWQPIDITAPPKWHVFIGRQIGGTTLGFAAAYCPTVFFVGFELLDGPSRGVGVVLGPLAFYLGILRRASEN